MKFTTLTAVILAFGIVAGFALAGGASLQANETGPEREVVLSGINEPVQVAFDSDGNLYFADGELGFIGKVISPETYETIASPGRVRGIAIGTDDVLYYSVGFEIRALTLSSGEETTILSASPGAGSGIAGLELSGGFLYYGEAASPGSVRRLDLATGETLTIASNLAHPSSVSVDLGGNVAFSELSGPNFGGSVSVLQAGSSVPKVVYEGAENFAFVFGVDYDDSTGDLYITHQDTGSPTEVLVLRLEAASAEVEVILDFAEGTARIPEFRSGYLYWGEQNCCDLGRIVRLDVSKSNPTACGGSGAAQAADVASAHSNSRSAVKCAR